MYYFALGSETTLKTVNDTENKFVLNLLVLKLTHHSK